MIIPKRYHCWWFIAGILVPNILLAQTSLPEPTAQTPGGPGPPPPGLPLPIDQHVIILILAAILLGIYILRLNRLIPK